jgi:HEAT repeat protein
MLDDNDSNVSAAAADALGVLGGADVSKALEALALRETADSLVRVSALRALARLEVPVEVSQYESLLTDSVLRPAAYGVLACSDQSQAEEWLLKGITMKGRAPRNAAMEGLVAILSRRDGAEASLLCEKIRSTVESHPEVVDAIIADLSSGDLSRRMTQVQFLGLVPTPGAAVAILEAGRDEAISELALRTLEGLGGAAEEAIEAAWDGLDDALRREACGVLGSTGGERGAARLQLVLDGPDATLRTAAIAALGDCACLEAVPALLMRLEVYPEEDDDDAAEERTVVTQTLVHIALAESTSADAVSQMVGELTARLDGAPEAVRLAVARVLGQIGRPSDEQHVSILLRDPSADVRQAAVEALARLAQGEACEALRLALADEASGVRCAAARALGESRADFVIDDLERLCDDEDVRVRAFAVRALGEHGGAVDASRTRALNRIEAALADEVPVIIAAGEALSVLGGAPAARVATRMLDHDIPEVVLTAVECIRAHGNAEALDHLLPFTAHADWSVRAEVVQTLGERRFARSVPAILRRLEIEQDSFVRDTILNALRRLEG